MTLRDVAAASGVSTTTASKALNGIGRMSEATRQRVRKAAGDLAGFGQKPDLRFLAWEAWKAGQDPDEAQATHEHIARSPNCSIAKAERLLGYALRYSWIEAVQESVAALMQTGLIE